MQLPKGNILPNTGFSRNQPYQRYYFSQFTHWFSSPRTQSWWRGKNTNSRQRN